METARGPVRDAFVLIGHAHRLPGKFQLPYEGEPILQREIRILRSAGLRIQLVSVVEIVVSGVRTLRDARDAGPLGGLATVLETTDRPFFLFGGDMPLLDPEGIQHMRRRFRGRPIVPVGAHGAWEVLHAIYAGVNRPQVEQLIAQRGGLKDLVDEMDRTGQVDWMPLGEINARSFVDIDTPEAYARLVAPDDSTAGSDRSAVGGVGTKS